MLIKPHRQLITQPHRHAWLEINLSALEQNARWWRKHTSAHAELMAVVKADAYGHGVLLVASLLKEAGFSWLGVSNVDEALQLRQGGVEMPILVLGATPDWAWQTAREHDIRLTIFSLEHVKVLKSFKHAVTVHIKVESGMHRLGASPQEALAIMEACEALPHVKVEGLFTHFANGDDALKTQAQWDLFYSEVVRRFKTPPAVIHASNTPSLLNPAWQSEDTKTACSLMRIGIGLYGYDTTCPELHPVMGLKSRISHLQNVPAGEGISYGHTFITTKDTPIATIPLGYADGIPRLLSNRLMGRFRGVLVPQVGNITMDQMMFDLSPYFERVSTDPAETSHEAPPQVGEVITLLEHGQQGVAEREKMSGGLSLNHWAEAIGTIPYELMCGLRVRLPRSVVRV
jgi:alanine racemase